MEAIGTTTSEPTARPGLADEAAEPASAGVTDEALHPQDLALARRAAHFEEAAWREIYDRTRRRLFALLAYHTGDREEALELLQETYLCAIRSIPRYDGRGSLEAWLAVIALRRASDWKRSLLRRRRRDDFLARDLAGDEALARAPLPDGYTRRRLWSALARLTSRQRSALLLHELAGLSYHAVGRALGCSEATARSHGFHARRLLRELLGSAPDALPAAEAGGRCVSDCAPGVETSGKITEVNS